MMMVILLDLSAPIMNTPMLRLFNSVCCTYLQISKRGMFMQTEDGDFRSVGAQGRLLHAGLAYFSPCSTTLIPTCALCTSLA